MDVPNPQQDDTKAGAEPELPTTSKTPPTFDVNSIYPTPVSMASPNARQLPTSVNAKLQDRTHTKTDGSTIAKILVLLLGLYIIGSAIWSSVSLLQLGYLATVPIAINVLSVIVGIGIVFRKQLARIAYVFVLVIGLISSLAGLPGLLNSYSQEVELQQAQSTPLVTPVAQAPPADVSMQQLAAGASAQQAQDEAQRSAQRDQYASQLRDIVEKPAQSFNFENIPAYIYLLLAVGYVSQIILLIFLTRPGVKRLFN